MVTVSDGLGRPLYVIDHEEGRLHPYTYEKVEDDFVYKYPNKDISSINWLFIVLGIGSILASSIVIFS